MHNEEINKLTEEQNRNIPNLFKTNEIPKQKPKSFGWPYDYKTLEVSETESYESLK